MPYRRFVWPALAAVAAVVIALVVTSLGDNLTYYLTPSEAVARRDINTNGERFRLGGLVVEGSLTEDGNVKRFQVTDGAETIDVELTAPAPPLFAEGIGVVVEGRWAEDSFLADLALVRHDENYVVPTTLP
ncbi:MAG TPA: cytochrome c maturation protein CcmE [Acidimicrobiia bacterium]|nr:cytochrome c maturation protein CcmE [Acidimicrobiia bacterium]